MLERMPPPPPILCRKRSSAEALGSDAARSVAPCNANVPLSELANQRAPCDSLANQREPFNLETPGRASCNLVGLAAQPKERARKAALSRATYNALPARLRAQADVLASPEQALALAVASVYKEPTTSTRDNVRAPKDALRPHVFAATMSAQPRKCGRDGYFGDRASCPVHAYEERNSRQRALATTRGTFSRAKLGRVAAPHTVLSEKALFSRYGP